MGDRFSGYLSLEDTDFRKKLLKVLSKNLYRTIRQIGSIHLDF